MSATNTSLVDLCLISIANNLTVLNGQSLRILETLSDDQAKKIFALLTNNQFLNPESLKIFSRHRDFEYGIEVKNSLQVSNVSLWKAAGNFCLCEFTLIFPAIQGLTSLSLSGCKSFDQEGLVHLNGTKFWKMNSND
jgi:hypothetical protein